MADSPIYSTLELPAPPQVQDDSRWNLKGESGPSALKTVPSRRGKGDYWEERGHEVEDAFRKYLGFGAQCSLELSVWSAAVRPVSDDSFLGTHFCDPSSCPAMAMRSFLLLIFFFILKDSIHGD